MRIPAYSHSITAASTFTRAHIHHLPIHTNTHTLPSHLQKQIDFKKFLFSLCRFWTILAYGWISWWNIDLNWVFEYIHACIYIRKLIAKLSIVLLAVVLMLLHIYIYISIHKHELENACVFAVCVYFNSCLFFFIVLFFVFCFVHNRYRYMYITYFCVFFCLFMLLLYFFFVFAVVAIAVA